MTAGERAFVERAQRFPLELPLRYLKSGVSEWNKGTTKNISRTGILFSTGEIPPIDSELEIMVQFPMNATLSCRGSVVRIQKPNVAVRIDKYDYSRSASN